MKISIKNNRFLFFPARATLSILAVSFAIFLFIQPAFADSIGESRTFFVDSSYDYTGRQEVSVTLRQIGQKAYFYIEDDWWNKLTLPQQLSILNTVSNLSQEFDIVIYPKLTTIYGSEWNPGIDNDSRITVLITKIEEGIGGYFKFADEYSQAQNLGSNEREMIYLSTAYIADVDNKVFLAHEFQHLITFFQKTKLRGLEEDTWLNEARSEYASTLLGYDNRYSGSNLERRVNAFMANSSDPLAEWRNVKADYGAVDLFMQYLVDHYGIKVLALMIQNDKVGLASIEDALQKLGTSDSFINIFINWAVANYLNNCNIVPLQSYCYLNSNLGYGTLHIVPTASYVLNSGFLELATWAKDWSPRWYKISAGDSRSKNLLIEFEGYGSNGNFVVPIILQEGNSYKIHLMNLSASQKGVAVVSDFGSRVLSAVLVPINTNQRTGFTSNDPNSPFSLKLSIVANLSSLYSDGSLLKADNDSKVYLIEGDARRWIPSAEIFVARGFGWDDIKAVSPSELAIYSDGSLVGWPDGTLIKPADSPAVFVVSVEKLRVFPSAEIFLALGYQWNRIKTLSRQEVERYVVGGSVQSLLHPDGALIKFADSPNVYLIEDGKKRLIPSIETFESNHFSFDLVLTVASGFRAKYPDGTIVER